MTSKWETWSRGTNSRLTFDVNVMLNLFVSEIVTGDVLDSYWSSSLVTVPEAFAYVILCWCCDELHFGTVLEDKFWPNFQQNLAIANDTLASPKQWHSAIQHGSDPDPTHKLEIAYALNVFCFTVISRWNSSLRCWQKLSTHPSHHFFWKTSGTTVTPLYLLSK